MCVLFWFALLLFALFLHLRGKLDVDRPLNEITKETAEKKSTINFQS